MVPAVGIGKACSWQVDLYISDVSKLIHDSLRPWGFLLMPVRCQSIMSQKPDVRSAAEPLGHYPSANDHIVFLRDCVECLLLHSGKPDNQTCHHQCKDEVITWVDAIGECSGSLWTAVSVDLGRL